MGWTWMFGLGSARASRRKWRRKSTLMHQLFGMLQPDSGDILINGEKVHFRSPADAISAGIGMIHQHFMLVETMTVAQNLALGRKSTKGLLLDLDVVSEEIRQLSKDYGLQVDPDAYIWQLSVGEQQRVEILKALHMGASLIILDEPTAVLTPGEVDDLFVILRRMVEEGTLPSVYFSQTTRSAGCQR
jgi:ABC-type uncharacterized transport system ATPase subunit